MRALRHLSLLIVILRASLCCAQQINDYGAAGTKTLEALYVETGLSKYIDAYGKYLDKNYVPDAYRTQGTVAFIVLQCGVRQQISWKWSF